MGNLKFRNLKASEIEVRPTDLQYKAVLEPYNNQTIDNTKKTNKEILKDFCGEKKKEKGVDIKELLRFYNFYELKCDKWSGEFKVEELYKKWYDGRKK